MLEISATAIQSTVDFDLVLSPVSPVTTFSAAWPSPTNDVARPLEHIGFTAPYNFSGQPASSVNCGWDAEGKPIGLQIAGRRFADLAVLRATHWYERARGHAATPVWPPASMSEYAGSAV
jgi:aspartyl-tRNA(Asn)/glutamyl-tRNA(Gln) amidotransferase subunit A